MTLSDKYIPLDRRFAELGDAKDQEDLALRSYIGRAMDAPRGIGWQDLYRDDRSCVILGEPGSGKSREMEGPAVAAALLPAIKDVLGDAVDDATLAAWGEAYGVLADILIAREAALSSRTG